MPIAINIEARYQAVECPGINKYKYKCFTKNKSLDTSEGNWVKWIPFQCLAKFPYSGDVANLSRFPSIYANRKNFQTHGSISAPELPSWSWIVSLNILFTACLLLEMLLSPFSWVFEVFLYLRCLCFSTLRSTVSVRRDLSLANVCSSVSPGTTRCWWWRPTCWGWPPSPRGWPPSPWSVPCGPWSGNRHCWPLRLLVGSPWKKLSVLLEVLF